MRRLAMAASNWSSAMMDERLNPAAAADPGEPLAAGEPSNGSGCAPLTTASHGRAGKLLLGSVLTLMTLGTIGGNLLVVVSVCAVKKLRQPANYLIVSLAAADLSVAVAVMPFVSVTDLTGGRWRFGRWFCNVFVAMDVMCCTASILTLCAISIDRYLGITKPLTYPMRQDGRCMAKMIAWVWLLSASITLPPLFGWAKNVNDGRVCLISQDRGYTVYSTAVAFYIPVSVMLFTYSRIYRAAKISAAKHAVAAFPLRGDHGSADSASVKDTEEDEADEETNLQHHDHHHHHDNDDPQQQPPRRPRKNQGSIFRREQKAAATLGLVVGAFSVCWLPFFLLSTARPFACGGASAACGCVPLWLERTLLWLGYANSLINPFIYAFFNRDLRATYANLLRCRFRNINRKLSAAGVHEALKMVRARPPGPTRAHPLPVT
ncbi:5-hydroxytryptamine receptor 7-like [Hippocampus zosterae]|uniref:5-hydroxytryptamine receptor 7-like n=1 Tax=Hippocampus zosterae TaxID=109293 RepID=UPI00223D6BF0|nr:5-hydroxytryptamine receptor 7-like [Hippocampus zosterae]